MFSAYCQCSKHTDQPSKREGKGLLCEAVTLVLYIKLRQKISAAHTCEALNEQLPKEAEVLRSFYAEETAGVQVHISDQYCM